MTRGALPGPLTPHHRRLVLAILAPDDQLEQRYLRWWSDFDPTAPVDAGSHRLLPLLWTRVRGLDAAAEFEGRLRGIYRYAWVHNQQVLAATGPALQTLADAAVPMLLVKGAALLQREYRDLGARPMNDLDVVVPQADAERARRALCAAGWRPFPGAASPLGPGRGADTLVHTENGPHLDVHWRAPGDVSQVLLDGWLWRDATPVQVSGAPCYCPAPTPHLLVTLAHGLRGNAEPPVRWVVDAARIIEGAPQGIDWAALVAAAEQGRNRTRVGAGLRLLEDLDAACVPTWVHTALARDSVVERWEFRVRAVEEARANRIALALAVYYASRRERPLPTVAAGLVPHTVRRIWVNVRRLRRRFGRPESSASPGAAR